MKFSASRGIFGATGNPSAIRIRQSRADRSRCARDPAGARALFQTALQDTKPAATQISTGPFAGMPESSLPPPGFGASRKGWVALAMRPVIGSGNFEGCATSETALPPPGTVLTARFPLPVWRAAQGRAPNSLDDAQGRLATRECVRVIATGVGPDRLWAEDAPAACS